MSGSVLALQSALAWLQGFEHELLVFAVFWFALGTLDELAFDLTWLWLKLTGRAREQRVPQGFAEQALSGRAAVLIPAWREAGVIGATVAHALSAWPQREYALYVGCYRNDADTLAAAMAAVSGDARVRLVVHDCPGPTTKADCLNRLYDAMALDEERRGWSFRSVVLHDAEDMVHPAALAAIDAALDSVDFVQLPVRPEPQPRARWIAGHYADEFAESHAKALVVRDALGAGIPAAGVGCGFTRAALARLAEQRRGEGEAGPFAAQCLTEDYELGLLLSRSGRGSRFLRLRDADGALVATRSFFPADLGDAVRQKTRWMHGIALQGWERLGWSFKPIDLWMALRDRRGPLTSLVLFVAYLLLVIELALYVARGQGFVLELPRSPLLDALMGLTLFGLVWRALMRSAFTAAEYGLAEGARALLRIPVANIIAIMAGRRALAAYIRGLLGERPVWEKTAHSRHPAQAMREQAT
ncbi:MAG: glycosyl transferase family protein [Novosphingobium sp.]